MIRPKTKIARWEKFAACQAIQELDLMIEGIETLIRWNPITPAERRVIALRRAELLREDVA